MYPIKTEKSNILRIIYNILIENKMKINTNNLLPNDVAKFTNSVLQNNFYEILESSIKERQFGNVIILYKRMPQRQPIIFFSVCKSSETSLAQTLFRINPVKFMKYKNIAVQHAHYESYEILPYFFSSYEMCSFICEIYGSQFTENIVGKLLKYQSLITNDIRIFYSLFDEFSHLITRKILTECFDITCVNNHIPLARFIFEQCHCSLSLRTKAYIRRNNYNGFYDDLIHWLKIENIIS